jgi:hypothetical protein
MTTLLNIGETIFREVNQELTTLGVIRRRQNALSTVYRQSVADAYAKCKTELVREQHGRVHQAVDRAMAQLELSDTIISFLAMLKFKTGYLHTDPSFLTIQKATEKKVSALLVKLRAKEKREVDYSFVVLSPKPLELGETKNLKLEHLLEKVKKMGSTVILDGFYGACFSSHQIDEKFISFCKKVSSGIVEACFNDLGVVIQKVAHASDLIYELAKIELAEQESISEKEETIKLDFIRELGEEIYETELHPVAENRFHIKGEKKADFLELMQEREIEGQKEFILGQEREMISRENLIKLATLEFKSLDEQAKAFLDPDNYCSSEGCAVAD